jgi:hypothetical protein
VQKLSAGDFEAGNGVFAGPGWNLRASDHARCCAAISAFWMRPVTGVEQVPAIRHCSAPAMTEAYAHVSHPK